MSAPTPHDPSFQPAAVTDEQLLAAHEKLLEKQPDDKAHYKLMPLALLFFFSGLILFAATYLNRYSGHFDSTVYNENTLPVKGGAEAPIDPVVMGKRLFNSSGACVTCHQASGVGVVGIYPPLAGSDWVNGPQDRVISIVLYGLQGPVHVSGNAFVSSAVMPSFGASGFGWSDDKIADVLTYVRQEWGNKGGPITADEVAAVRAKDGSRAAWSEADLLQIK
jgi:mono/diheme cytochrome c family protein